MYGPHCPQSRWSFETRHCRRRHDTGFGLLEMIIAMAVLGISLLGLAQLLGLSIQQNSLSRYDTVAVQVARGKLEELRGLFSRQLKTGVSASDLADGEHGPETFELPPEDSHFGVRSLSLRWTVSSPASYRKDIEIFVGPAGASTADGESGGNSLYARTVSINATIMP